MNKIISAIETVIYASNFEGHFRGKIKHILIGRKNRDYQILKEASDCIKSDAGFLCIENQDELEVICTLIATKIDKYLPSDWITNKSYDNNDLDNITNLIIKDIDFSVLKEETKSWLTLKSIGK